LGSRDFIWMIGQPSGQLGHCRPPGRQERLSGIIWKAGGPVWTATDRDYLIAPVPPRDGSRSQWFKTGLPAFTGLNSTNRRQQSGMTGSALRAPPSAFGLGRFLMFD